MLVEFKVTNFRSFRDTQVFSMVASSDQTLADNTITTAALGKRRLLRSAVVYGANAAGKSNLIIALNFVSDFVTKAADRKPRGEMRFSPFLLDKEHPNAPSEFEVTFIHDEIRYQYGFSLDQSRVHQEWLIAYPRGVAQTWFERSPLPDGKESEWYFGPNYTGERSRLTSLTRPDALFLSVAATFNHKQLSKVYAWLTMQLQVVDPTSGDVALDQLTATLVNLDESVFSRVRSLVQRADLGIVHVSSEEQDKWTEDELPLDLPDERRSLLLKSSKQVDIKLQHETGERDGEPVLLPFGEESLGTRRLFGLGGPWVVSLAAGLVLVVDELDASMHPILVRTLVRMFHDPEINRHNAQLIFNTHDTTLLDSGVFRRDQIWFVEKDRAGASHLYPLLEFSPRKDEALEKGYLQGRYGAIPFVSDLLDEAVVHA